MLDCFLLLHQAVAKWFPLVAIPAVIAGGLVSICLIVSGIKGILTCSFRPKRKVGHAVHPERVVQWIAPSGHGRHT